MNSRNILSVFHILPGALCLLANPLSAEISGLFTYTNDGTSITISGCSTSASGTVNVPSKIAGKPVTTIGSYAFSGCTGLTSITFPASVSAIEGNAFYGCSALTSFSVDSGNKNFTSVTGVIFNKAKSILIAYPGGKSGNYTVPNGVTSIGSGAFISSGNLTGVTLPAGLIDIGYQAFQSCSALTGINIPQSVTRIGSSSFYGCTGFTSITIPANVASIEDAAFIYCSGLKEFIVSGANAHYSSMGGVLFDKARKTLVICPGAKSRTYAIPSTVTTIDWDAFSGCSNLNSVTLSNNVTTIMNNAFSFCPGLTSVTIPAKVKSIGTTAFYGCNNLAQAAFLGNAPVMGSSVFDSAASGFKIHFIKGNSGFASPTWQGYPCTGSAASTEIDIQQPIGTSLVDGTTSKTFGKLPAGVTGTGKTFTIWNAGTADLTKLHVTIIGTNAANFILIPPSKTALGPNASTTFKVSFKPNYPGTRTATLRISSNDADENPFDINLTGDGVAP